MCHSERNAEKRRIWPTNKLFSSQMLRFRLSMTAKIDQFEYLNVKHIGRNHTRNIGLCSDLKREST
jgi:hypothetical protein